jgi:integrase/recombinase XerD
MTVRSLKKLPENPLIMEAFEEFLVDREIAQRSPNTITHYRYTAGMFIKGMIDIGVLNPEEISHAHVRMYLSGLVDRGLSPSSIASHARGIRAFLRWLAEEGWTQELVRFSMPKPPAVWKNVLTEDDIKKILAATNDRDYLIVLVALDSGLRLSELAALVWDDIDFRSGLLTVQSGKGSKSRYSTLGLQSRKRLLRYRRQLSHRSGSDAVFQTRSGSHFSPEGLKQVFRRLSKSSGVKFSCHDLRRLFAVKAIEDGVPEIRLMELLGHSSLMMSAHYARISGKNLAEIGVPHSLADRLLK